MAHPAQQHFMLSVKQKFPQFFNGIRVLDVGSLDINGSNRYLFENNCKYLGIDIGMGNNVDIVCRAHEFVDYYGFDTIVSTECFEHDEFLNKTLENIVKLLKSNGLFAFTCATTNRAEHGTKRANAWASPFTSLLSGDYYKNITEKDIKDIIDIENIFKEYTFISNTDVCDLYFWGIKY